MSATLLEMTTTMRPEEAGDLLKVTTGTLANWRVTGKGPKHCKVGSRVLYRLSDIAEYLDAQTRTSTSDRGPDA